MPAIAPGRYAISGAADDPASSRAGRGGCQACADVGRTDAGKRLPLLRPLRRKALRPCPALLYVLVHDGHQAVKIGITGLEAVW
ncbi:hypothetical protein [Streptomyces sp. NPDC002851]